MKLALYSMVVFAFFACSKKEKKLGEDWSATPLSPKSIALKSGKSSVTVTLNFPKEMKLDKEYAKEDNKRFIAVRDDHYNEPGFTLSLRADRTFKDLKEAKSSAYIDNDMIIAEEKALSKDQFLFVFHIKNKGLLYVRTYTNFNNMVIECQGSQAKRGGVPNFPATVAWLKKVCTSVSFK